MSKIIAVAGATGFQGGSVARALLKEPSKWKVVALTRDTEGAKATELKQLGAEIRKCDLANISDVEAALKGAYGVFAVTDYASAKSYDNELKHGHNLIDAAKKLGVEHFVFSSLESANKISGGAVKVPHFDSKAELEEYLIKSGLPYSLVQASGYFENYHHLLKPSQNTEGQLEFGMPILPENKTPLFSVQDTGAVVSVVLNDKARFLGKKIAMVSEYLSPNEIAALLSKQFGKPVKYNYIPANVFGNFPFPMASEIASMCDYFNKCGYYGEKTNNGRNIWEAKELVTLTTFADWVKNWKL